MTRPGVTRVIGINTMDRAMTLVTPGRVMT